MKLVILITGRTDQTITVAQSWQDAGASGVTILEGYGLRNLQERMVIRNDLPLIPSLTALLRHQEVSAVLLISLVDDELVKALEDATTAILGDLTLPNNGIIFTLAVESAIGLVLRS